MIVKLVNPMMFQSNISGYLNGGYQDSKSLKEKYKIVLADEFLSDLSETSETLIPEDTTHSRESYYLEECFQIKFEDISKEKVDKLFNHLQVSLENFCYLKLAFFISSLLNFSSIPKFWKILWNFCQTIQMRLLWLKFIKLNILKKMITAF